MSDPGDPNVAERPRACSPIVPGVDFAHDASREKCRQSPIIATTWIPIDSPRVGAIFGS